ncbi:MAG: response regulator [Bacteroidota bacterium]
MKNETLNVLIVEDQMIIATDLAMHLESIGFRVAAIVTSGEHAIATIEAQEVDIAIMDVRLEGALSGIETVKAIQQIKEVAVVFVTANSDDATFNEAKETHPFAFISKPFNKKEITRTLTLLRERLLREPTTSIGFPTNENTTLEDRIFLKTQEKMVRLFLNEIYYIQAERAYCNIYTKSKKHTLAMSMKELMKQIEVPHLQRIHRSHIVNIQHVNAISDREVEVNGEKLAISKTYQEAFFKNFKLLK